MGRYVNIGLASAVFLAAEFLTEFIVYFSKKASAFFGSRRFVFLAAFFFAGFANIAYRNNPVGVLYNCAKNGERASVTGYVVNAIGSGYIVLCQNEKILVYANDSDLAPGNLVELSGALRVTLPMRNPGGFDEKTYFAARGVYCKLVNAQYTVTGQKNDFFTYLYDLRLRLAAVYDYCLNERYAGVAKAIILGDRANLPDDIKTNYSAAGIYHVLAISGLHISVIGLFLNAVLKKITRKSVSGFVTVAFLVCYCLLTGASPSTVRAVIIASVFILGDLIYKKSDALTSLAFAALCILAYSPFYLWDAGFLLSFSAVLGVLALTRPISILFLYIGAKNALFKRFFANSYIKTYLSASCAAFLSVLCVCTSFLPRFGLYAVIINAALLPTFSLLVITGLITGLLGLISLNAAVFTAGAPYFLLSFYDLVVNSFAKLPFNTVLTGYIPPYLTFFYYAFLCVSAFCLLKAPRARRYKKYAALGFLCLLCAIYARFFAPEPFYLTMLDVGHGDCFVLKKNNFCAVIDGGGRLNVPPGNNTGAKTLAPYLDYLGVSKVDFAVITHSDYDHAAGVAELLTLKPVKTLYLSEFSDGANPMYNTVMEAAAANNTTVAYLKQNEIIDERYILITCLSPDIGRVYTDENDQSLVLRIDYKNASFLLTGDITQNAENYLCADNRVKCDVLKLSHHGSGGSNSENFLKTVSPAIALASYSQYNNYGLPNADVMRRIVQTGAVLYETSKSGAVIITVKGGKLIVRETIF